jgi:hypothetical protein
MELKHLAAQDDKLQNLTEEEEEMLINRLIAHREKTVSGLRANNVAASRDVVSTVSSLIKEVCNLISPCTTN